MTREDEIAASRREIRDLPVTGVSEVTPSRRDFTRFLATGRQGLAVVARLPERGTDAAILERARLYDDAEVAALSFRGAAALGIPSMARVIAAVSAPILHERLVLDRNQVFASRLVGADAVVLPVGELEPASLEDLVSVTRSLHMAPVLEVCDRAQLQRAIAVPFAVIALRCEGVDRQPNLDRARELAAVVPSSRICLVLPEVPSLAAATGLVGISDAVLLGDLLLETGDPAESIASVLRL